MPACVLTRFTCKMTYCSTSLLRSPTGLDKSDINGEVTVLQGVHCTVDYNLALGKSDRNGEVTLLVILLLITVEPYYYGKLRG